jgi:hypothetical protein
LSLFIYRISLGLFKRVGGLQSVRGVRKFEMTKRNKTAAAILAVAFCSAAAGTTGLGRRTVSALLSRVSSESVTHPSGTRGAQAPQSGPDVETRARAAHGWDGSVRDWVAIGAITYNDQQGKVTNTAPLTIYRKYPDKLRVEARGVATFGFDQARSWKALTASALAPAQARDIRAWARFTPERLFVSRTGGGAYREVGQDREDFRTALPGGNATVLSPPLLFNQVEMIDHMGLGAAAGGPHDDNDIRRIYYYIGKDDSVIAMCRWNEPDDPKANADDPRTDKTAVQVDFSDWERAGGVLWPFRITHWFGGKVDFQISLIEVLLNQNPQDTLFHGP